MYAAEDGYGYVKTREVCGVVYLGCQYRSRGCKGRGRTVSSELLLITQEHICSMETDPEELARRMKRQPKTFQTIAMTDPALNASH
jgi:hypothetical protein